jgi:hypothetical protein
MMQQQCQVDEVADRHCILVPKVVHHKALAIIDGLLPFLLLLIVVATPTPTSPPIIFLAATTTVTMLVGRVSIREVGKGDMTVLIGGAWAIGYITAPPFARAPPSCPPAQPQGIALGGAFACLVGSVRGAEGSGGYQQRAS